MEGESLPLLLETIHIQEGEAWHLSWHQARMDRCSRRLFGGWEAPRLQGLLTDRPRRGLWRCRVLYRTGELRVEYHLYRPTLPRRFALAEYAGEYRCKYAERGAFNQLLRAHPQAQELLLCRDGLLTDTTRANIALRRGGRWYTPAEPLLEGTTRARLLAQGRIEVADIPCDSLWEWDGLALMNAMVGFAPVEEPIYIM